MRDSSARRIRYSDQYRPQRGADPARAEQVLRGALSRLGLDREIARYRFVLHWADIVGDEIAQRATPECIKNRVLVVRVSDSSWAQELSFQKRAILTRLKRHLNADEVIDDVIFYVAGSRPAPRQ